MSHISGISRGVAVTSRVFCDVVMVTSRVFCDVVIVTSRVSCDVVIVTSRVFCMVSWLQQMFSRVPCGHPMFNIKLFSVLKSEVLNEPTYVIQ